MRKLLMLAATAATLYTVPAAAFYAECTVTKDTELKIMPNGPTERRWRSLDKGDKVAYRARYHNWWFVVHWNDNEADYGWLPRSVLSNCHEITP